MGYFYEKINRIAVMAAAVAALRSNLYDTSYQCTSGNLLVPDADNLTDVNIYNCVLSLLEKYDEESVR